MTKILPLKGIFNYLLLLQDFNFSEVECWCIGFDEADISGYFDSFSVDSCLSLPKSAAVLPKVKPPMEDWNLQVQLFSQVEVEFFKVSQADPYKHRKPKSCIVRDTENLLHNKSIHGINTFDPKKSCADSSHCALLSLINQTFFPNKNNPVQVLNTKLKPFL